MDRQGQHAQKAFRPGMKVCEPRTDALSCPHSTCRSVFTAPAHCATPRAYTDTRTHASSDNDHHKSARKYSCDSDNSEIAAVPFSPSAFLLLSCAQALTTPIHTPHQGTHRHAYACPRRTLTDRVGSPPLGKQLMYGLIDDA